MTGIAAQIDELRLAVGEVDILAAITQEWFDDADWSGAEPLLVERAGYRLGMMAQLAAFTASKIDGFHVTLADTQPALAGDPWSGESTASGDHCVGNIATGTARSGRRQPAAISIDDIESRQGA